MPRGFARVYMGSFTEADFWVLHHLMGACGLSILHPDTHRVMHFTEDGDWAPLALEEILERLREGRSTGFFQWWFAPGNDLCCGVFYEDGCITLEMLLAGLNTHQLSVVLDVCVRFFRYEITEGHPLGVVVDVSEVTEDLDWDQFFCGTTFAELDSAMPFPNMLVVADNRLPRRSFAGIVETADLGGGFVMLRTPLPPDREFWPVPARPLSERQLAARLLRNALMDRDAVCSCVLGRWPTLSRDRDAARALEILTSASDPRTDRFDERTMNRHLSEIACLLLHLAE